MKQTFNVSIYLRTDKKRKDGKCPIYYRVTLSSVATKLPTGHYLFEKDWDKVRSQERGSSSSDLNLLLKREKARLEAWIYEQRTKDRFITREMLKSFYNNDNDAEDFYRYYADFCKSRFLDIEPGTKYHYDLMIKRLKEFCPVLRFTEIDLRFIKAFNRFLVGKGCGKGGASTQHKKFKAVLSEAFKDRLINYNPYMHFPIYKSVPKIASLTMSEVERIENMDLGKYENAMGLTVCRDLFLFSCYTGLRYQDVVEFKRSSIIDDSYLSLIMSKTKFQVEVPIFDKVLEIVSKYSVDGVDTVFPYRTNQNLNKNLKEIGEVCKIDTRMTFHLARHTFGTMAARSGISIFDVSKSMGHRSVSQTQDYVNTELAIVKEKFAEQSFFSRTSEKIPAA